MISAKVKEQALKRRNHSTGCRGTPKSAAAPARQREVARQAQGEQQPTCICTTTREKPKIPPPPPRRDFPPEVRAYMVSEHLHPRPCVLDRSIDLSRASDTRHRHTSLVSDSSVPALGSAAIPHALPLRQRKHRRTSRRSGGGGGSPV